MEEIIIFILMCYGLSAIVLEGSIFENFRKTMDVISPNFFGILFSCYRCFGFWAGVFLSCFYPLINLSIDGILGLIISFVLHGSLSSGTCWIIANYILLIEKKISIIDQE